MSDGVTPAGFARKRLPAILADIEAKAQEVFGPGIVQSPQSPLGQLNGMFASLCATLWEVAEDTYQSYDPDQAEGVRLEQLARIRLLERMDGELDPAFRAAITNAGRARIGLADIARAITGVEGVIYVRVVTNDAATPDPNGLAPHAIAAAVIGGDDAEVARALYPYVVPGVATWGNARADLAIDGYCRTIRFIRPSPIRGGLRLIAQVRPDALGCPPPSAGAIALAAVAGLSGAARPANGEALTLHRVRTAVSCTYPNVEVTAAEVALTPLGTLVPLPMPVPFTSIFEVDAMATTVALP